MRIKIICTVMLILTVSGISNSGIPKSLFKPENAGLLEVMRKGLEQFQVDMTRSFMEAHSRQKRAMDGMVKDMNLGKQLPVKIEGESVGPFSTFTFQGVPYVIKKDGIYEITGVEFRSLKDREAISDDGTKLIGGKWSLPRNEMVLHGMEWKRSFYLLTTNGTFSTIYTIQSNNLYPAFQQRIFNRGNAVTAEFFEYRGKLYLVMCNDNEIHSTTFSAIFRWDKSYMDEIHQVQTTGAKAVQTFTINSRKYIAIAQSRDSTGNMELGTIILSMDHKDRLERVQLLWSHGARDLHYMTTEKEHFLVIAQETKASIVYWFEGMDFMYWQQFEGLKGSDLFLNGYQLDSDQPVLVASDGGPLRFFTRSASSASTLMTTWVQSKTFDSRKNVDLATTNEQLIRVKFLRVGKADNEKTLVAITSKVAGSISESTKIFDLNVKLSPISITTAPKEDPLGQCLQSLEASLKTGKPVLLRIQEEGSKVLRTDKDVQFNGVLETKRIVKMDPTESKVKQAQITPKAMSLTGRSSNDKIKSSPSKLLSSIQDDSDRLEILKSDMENVLYKSGDKNVITGNLEFTGSIEFNDLTTSPATDLQADSVNSVSWNDLQHSTLKVDSKEGPQQVTGKWAAESIQGQDFLVTGVSSKLLPESFLLRTCPNNQTMEGFHVFQQGLRLIQGLSLGQNAKINEHLFSNVVMKDGTEMEIKGFKHAPFVKGLYTPQNVNNIDILEWFSSVAKINSPEAQHFTGPVSFSTEAPLRIDSLQVTEINSKNWDEFQTSVLLNGINQEIEGITEFDILKVDNLKTESISGVASEGLLTSFTTQHISSVFTLNNLHISEDLSTENINNGARLQEAVSTTSEVAEINGPIILESCQVQDILVPEKILIAGKDVSELNKLGKLHVYSTTDGSTLFLDEVNVDKLIAPEINGKVLGDLSTKYWSSTRNNVVDASQLVLSSRAASVSSDNFRSGTVNDFKFPEEFVSLDQSDIVLKGPIRFEKPVTFLEKVDVDESVTIENIDMSKVESMIVDENFQGLVRGKKTFADDIKAEAGASFVNHLNDMDLLNDVVLINAQNQEQKISGVLKFVGGIQSKIVTVQDNDVVVKGSVNGQNLEYVKNTTAYQDQPNFVEGFVTFFKGVDTKELSTEMLNNINVGEIRENVIFLDHPDEQIILGGFQLGKNVEISFLQNSGVLTINGLSMLDYLPNVVRLDSPPPSGLISGTKRFTNLVLKDQLHCTTVNGVNLQDLNSKAFSKTQSQEITGKWSLNDAKFQNNLETNEISGIPFGNFAFTDESFEIISPVEFKSEEGGSLKGPFKLNGKLNGIQFDENLQKFATLIGNKNFDDVTVNGDLEWAKDNEQPNFNGLTYFMNNAVQKSGPQVINGKIKFMQDVKTEEISSPEDNWLGGVNLQKLKDDALVKGDTEWVLSGENKFSEDLKIGNLAGTVRTADINDVNGINMAEMDRDVYKTGDSSGRTLEGDKTFARELTVDNLAVRDSISEQKVNEFVLKDDTRPIQQVQFQDISVTENINWEKVAGFDLQSLLKDRVSLTKPHQELEGPFTFEEVVVDKNCQVSQINEIKVNNTVRRDMVHLPPMSGKKIFAESLLIAGAASTDSLNNRPMHEILEQTLRLDKEEVITRPVIFEDSVIANQPMEVQSVNEVHLQNFSARVSTRLERLISDAQSPEHISMELQTRETLLQRFSEERPNWLEYLRLKEDLTDMGAKTKVNYVSRNEFQDVIITFHETTKDSVEKVGLPQGCSCNTVSTLQLKKTGESINTALRKGVENCLKVYHAVSKSSGTTYTVISETFSSNVTCLSEQDKTTRILAGDKLLTEMKMGDVSDLGVFSEGESDYLILAEYFDTQSKSHSTKTKVMKVSPSGVLETVQEIPTHGAKKVALGFVSNRWMLAIANSKMSESTQLRGRKTRDIGEESCIADSAIYVWSPEDKTFLLLRNVMTDDVFDVEFITTQAENEFYSQSFVAFAQKGDSASGEVIIFKYENMGGNFAMTQTIRSNWPITALRSACFCSNCYLMTAVPQEGVTFYENQFVEGFREYYKAPVFGATDITSFNLDDQYLFAIATVKGPILAEAVMSGPVSC